jgi:hypothetical protein
MAKTEKPQQDLMPSPPIGYPVLWFDGGRKQSAKPAWVMCQNQHFPGMLELSINLGSGLVKREAVLWAQHPDAQRVESPQVQRYGTWDYMADTTVPDSHFAVHMEQLEQAERNRVATEEHVRRLREEAARPQPEIDTTIQELAARNQRLMNAAGA